MLKFRVVHLSVVLLTLAACRGPTSNSGIAASPTPTPGSGGSSSNTLPLEMVLQSAYAYSTGVTPTKVTEVDCQVPVGQTVGTNVACTIQIPEGRLHFSHLFFNLMAGSSCEIVTFQPYYYIGSEAAGYQPPWQTAAIDCSAVPLPVSCYEGAAPQLQPTFPTNSGFYYAPSTAGYNANWELKSANENNRPSNRYSTNNLPPGAGANERGTTFTIAGSGGEKYYQNSMVDYYFSCRDRWFQLLYGITLTVSDAYDSTGTVTSNSAQDYFADWLSTNHLEAQTPSSNLMKFMTLFSKP